MHDRLDTGTSNTATMQKFTRTLTNDSKIGFFKKKNPSKSKYQNFLNKVGISSKADNDDFMKRIEKSRKDSK